MGLFDIYYPAAQDLLDKMTLEEKVGQMFLARYPEKRVNEEIESHHPGGYIIFRNNLEGQTPHTMKLRLKNNQEASKVPLFLATDEEGGEVCRFSAVFRRERFRAPQEVAKDGLNKLILDTMDKIEFLQDFGVNVNLAPVCDMSDDPESFIYKRSMGMDPEGTGNAVASMVKCYNAQSIVSCLKHFPGHGNNEDTHKGEAIDSRTYQDLEDRDFIPFRKGIKADAPMVMVGHQILNSIHMGVPASCSRKVIGILRNEIEFSGVVITDDLAMGAIKKYKTPEEVAIEAVKAGNDMLISSDFRNQAGAVLNEVKAGEIQEEVVNIAVRRILACKMRYGIIK